MIRGFPNGETHGGKTSVQPDESIVGYEQTQGSEPSQYLEEKTGLDDVSMTLLDVDIPLVKLPIFPGKNVTVITEVISLNYLLRHYGYDAAREFSKRLEGVIGQKKKGSRAISYFEHDFE